MIDLSKPVSKEMTIVFFIGKKTRVELTLLDSSIAMYEVLCLVMYEVASLTS